MPIPLKTSEIEDLPIGHLAAVIGAARRGDLVPEESVEAMEQWRKRCQAERSKNPISHKAAFDLVEENGWAINPRSHVDYDEWVTYWEVIERYSHDGKPHEKDKVLGTAATITEAVMIAAEMVCAACLCADGKHAPGCPDDPDGEGP